MNVRKVLLLSLPVTVLFFAAAVRASAETLQVSVTDQTISITNATAGGKVVLFSCARVSLERNIGVRNAAVVLSDDDHDGAISYNPPNGIPLRSVWAAVDEISGQIATGSRAEFPLNVTPISVDTDVSDLSVELPRLIILLVRPGVGAWYATEFDGQEGDHDGFLDGKVRLTFQDLKKIDGTLAAPLILKNNDSVVCIDPGQLDVFSGQVGH